MPDNKGVRLIDVASGTPLRALHRPDRSQVISVLADPAGQRLVTIESVAVADDLAAAMEATGELRRFARRISDQSLGSRSPRPATALRFRRPGRLQAVRRPQLQADRVGPRWWPSVPTARPWLSPRAWGAGEAVLGHEDGNELPGRPANRYADRPVGIGSGPEWFAGDRRRRHGSTLGPGQPNVSDRTGNHAELHLADAIQSARQRCWRSPGRARSSFGTRWPTRWSPC